MKSNPIIRRISDGALFEPAAFQDIPETDGLDALLNDEYMFFRIEWKQSGWWPFRRWVRTGEVYIPEDDRDWEVVS